MTGSDESLAFVDGKDALAFVIIRPGSSEGTVSGDFATPTADADTTAPAPSAPEPSQAPITDTGTPGQLPTTSGGEVAGIVTIGLIAALIIAAGLVLLRRSRSKGEW